MRKKKIPRPISEDHLKYTHTHTQKKKIAEKLTYDEIQIKKKKNLNKNVTFKIKNKIRFISLFCCFNLI